MSSGEWGFEIHPFFLGGVLKPQCFGVKGLTRQKAKTVLDELPVLGKGGAFEYGVPTVAGVVEQGVSNGLHVRADLVRPALSPIDIRSRSHNPTSQPSV